MKMEELLALALVYVNANSPPFKLEINANVSFVFSIMYHDMMNYHKLLSLHHSTETVFLQITMFLITHLQI